MTRPVGEPVAAPGNPLLEARDLAAGYGKPVVGPVSFGVEAGQVLGVWGPNGAGKSTLLGALAGAVRVFSGEVRRAAGARIAYQRQSPLALEGLPLTGRELLRLTGAPVGGLPAWLAPLVARRLDSLSQGQRQWLQIWASLGAGARLVLLDEPTNNLDPAGVQALESALAPAAPDRAVVVVSHDRRFLQAVSTHLLELGGIGHHGT